MRKPIIQKQNYRRTPKHLHKVRGSRIELAEESQSYKPWYASPGSETLEIRTKPNAAPDVVAIPDSD